MSIARNTADLLETYGSAWTLRRRAVAAGSNSWTEGAETITYHAQRAKLRGLEQDAVTGTVRDLHSSVYMSPDYTAPAIGDLAAEGTYTADGSAKWREIINVLPIEMDGVVSKYVVLMKR